ncbi:hypothetical protein, partial [Oribacterium sp. P9]|uniref:hypothetical protein n=1 Tax=Oribacterium sp. P9 TaxID=3378068 RepID=UPI0039678F8E
PPFGSLILWHPPAIIIVDLIVTLGPGTVKFLLKYSKLEFMVPGPNAPVKRCEDMLIDMRKNV